MRSVLTGFRFSPGLIGFGPCVGWFASATAGSGCETVMYSLYLPSLGPVPIVSVGSAIRIYATCAVFASHAILGVAGSLGSGQTQRLSPPESAAASIAAMTR